MKKLLARIAEMCLNRLGPAKEARLLKLLTTVSGWGLGFYVGKNPWQDSKETAAQKALVEIVDKLKDQTLSGLGREVRDIAIKGLRG